MGVEPDVSGMGIWTQGEELEGTGTEVGHLRVRDTQILRYWTSHKDNLREIWGGGGL
jgi:hypothetical protein